MNWRDTSWTQPLSACVGLTSAVLGLNKWPMQGIGQYVFFTWDKFRETKFRAENYKK